MGFAGPVGLEDCVTALTRGPIMSDARAGDPNDPGEAVLPPGAWLRAAQDC
jgi:hypothetical protein